MDELNYKITKIRGTTSDKMILMEEIWKVRPVATIQKKESTGEYVVQLLAASDAIIGKTLQEAICKAWLRVFEKK